MGAPRSYWQPDRSMQIPWEHCTAEFFAILPMRQWGWRLQAPLRRRARTAPQQVNNAQAKSESSIGQVSQAEADVRTAELNLGHTKIYAPVGGVIGRKTVELGQRIQPGETLLAIVPIDDIWVTADFKETQLKYMRPGQSVNIHVDTFGRDYRGTVENLPGA